MSNTCLQPTGKKAAEEQYDFLVLLDLMNQPQELGSEELAEKYRAKTGERISARTVRKLRSKYFFKRAKKPKPFLTRAHMDARMTHCEKAKEGTLFNEDRVMWVDEKVFKVHGDNGTVYLADPDDPAQWTEKRQKEIKAHFFGGICGFGTPPICEVLGNMDSNAYLRMLRDNYKPFISAALPAGQHVDWVQDNCPVHATDGNLAMMAFWRWHVIGHPAKSPDLNPIEFTWLVLQELLKHLRPRTKRELVEAVQHMWPLAASPEQFSHYKSNFYANVEHTVALSGGNWYKENKYLSAIRY